MNRFYLCWSNKLVVAILLLPVLVSAVYAQTTYNVAGTLSLVSGPDPIGLNGVSVSGSATLTQAMTPTISMTTSSSSTNIYNGVSGILLQGLGCSNVTTPSITLTDNAGADDTISLSNCTIQYVTVSATITIPNGNMITAVPAAIPLTNITGTVSYSIGGGDSIFDLTEATIFTTGADGTGQGDPPPAVTPSLASWTPTVALGSTTPVSQNITFTTAPSPGYDAVSFTTSVTTVDGGNWLAVTPAAQNSSAGMTITVNPAGLSQPTYAGTVMLSFGASGVAPISIPVTLTVSGGTATLTALPPAMTFNYTLGGNTVGPQTLAIGPVGSLSVNAAVTSGNSWLSVSPGSGSTPANFTVSVNTSGVSAGTLIGNIQITSPNLSPLNVPVTLNVASSSFSVQTTPLVFNYTVGGAQPAAQSASVSGTPGTPFGASAIVATPTGGTWLVATTSAGGTIPGSVNVSINTTGLTTPGSYIGTVVVSSATGSTGSIPVTLNVLAASITATPTALNFSYTAGGAAPASQSISVTAPTVTNFTATAATTSGGPWLILNSSAGTTPGVLSVSISTSALTATGAGTYSGTVTISPASGAPQTVNVSVTVAMPTLSATPASLNFAYQIGTTAPPAQTVNIGGTPGVTFTATPATTSGGSWLALNSTTGTISNSSSISVSVNTAGLTTAGTFSGTITVAATGVTPSTVNVTLTVSSARAISASPSSLSFSYQIGHTAPAAQQVQVGGTPGLSFTATAVTSSGGSWLVAGGGGTTPGNVSVSVNTSGLTTPGTYSGNVTIAANGANSQTVNVTLLVSNSPTITASPSSLNFVYLIGGTVPSAQFINITGGSALPFIATVTSGSSWLTVTPGSGTTPGSVSVSVNTTNLSAATYSGAVTISSSGASNGPLSIPVSLVVTGTTPTITISPSSLNFTSTVGGAAPASQTVNVTSTASSSLSVATLGGTWLTASLSGSTTPAVVTVSANPGNLGAGTYVGAVIVTSVGASNTPQGITVKLVVAPPSTIAVSPTNLSFAYILGGANPASQSVNVTSSQQTAITTSVVGGATWLTLSSSSTSTPATVTVSVNPATLTAGTYQAPISIASAETTNSPQVVSVTLVVSDKPTLAPSPSSLIFTAPAGSNPPTQSIRIYGSAALPFTITTSPSWVNVSAVSGTTPSSLVASVNTAGMGIGSYQGTITISSGTAANSPVSIPVTLNLTVPLVSNVPNISSIVNAASYNSSGFSPGTIVTIFGSFLGPKTPAVFALNSAGSVDSTLAGVSVKVEGVPAIPLYVQEGQVNVILPFDIGVQGQANVEVEYNNLTSAQFNIPLTPSDVAIFTANASGSGPGSILNQDLSINTAENPAAKGSIVAVYGTGGGLVTPSATVGKIAGAALSWVSLPYAATVNDESAAVQYAGTAPMLVYGVNQFNVKLPADVPSGAVKIVLRVGDSASQTDVTVFVR